MRIKDEEGEGGEGGGGRVEEEEREEEKIGTQKILIKIDLMYLCVCSEYLELKSLMYITRGLNKNFNDLHVCVCEHFYVNLYI